MADEGADPPPPEETPAPAADAEAPAETVDAPAETPAASAAADEAVCTTQLLNPHLQAFV